MISGGEAGEEAAAAAVEGKGVGSGAKKKRES